MHFARMQKNVHLEEEKTMHFIAKSRKRRVTVKDFSSTLKMSFHAKQIKQQKSKDGRT